MNYPRTTRDGCLCILRARLNIGEKYISLRTPALRSVVGEIAC